MLDNDCSCRYPYINPYGNEAGKCFSCGKDVMFESPRIQIMINVKRYLPETNELLAEWQGVEITVDPFVTAIFEEYDPTFNYTGLWIYIGHWGTLVEGYLNNFNPSSIMRLATKEKFDQPELNYVIGG